MTERDLEYFQSVLAGNVFPDRKLSEQQIKDVVDHALKQEKEVNKLRWLVEDLESKEERLELEVSNLEDELEKVREEKEELEGKLEDLEGEVRYRNDARDD